MPLLIIQMLFVVLGVVFLTTGKIHLTSRLRTRGVPARLAAARVARPAPRGAAPGAAAAAQGGRAAALPGGQRGECSGAGRGSVRPHEPGPDGAGGVEPGVSGGPAAPGTHNRGPVPPERPRPEGQPAPTRLTPRSGGGGTQPDP